MVSFCLTQWNTLVTVVALHSVSNVKPIREGQFVTLLSISSRCARSFRVPFIGKRLFGNKALSSYSYPYHAPGLDSKLL